MYPLPPISLVDLDDTLFQTHRRKKPESGWVVATVDKHGEPLAYMSLKQQNFLGFLISCTKPIAVTARSIEAFNRVKIDFKHGAICSHGASILNADGSLDQEWHSLIKQQLQAQIQKEYFAELAQEFEKIIQASGFEDTVRHWVVQENDLDIYFVIKQNNYTAENAFLNKLPSLIDPKFIENVYVHGNGNNLAFIPKCVTKAKAAAYLLEKLRTENPYTPVLGFGDSLSDLDFMFLTDFSCLPTGAQNQSWIANQLLNNNIKFG